MTITFDHVLYILNTTGTTTNTDLSQIKHPRKNYLNPGNVFQRMFEESAYAFQNRWDHFEKREPEIKHTGREKRGSKIGIPDYMIYANKRVCRVEVKSTIKNSIEVNNKQIQWLFKGNPRKEFGIFLVCFMAGFKRDKPLFYAFNTEVEKTKYLLTKKSISGKWCRENGDRLEKLSDFWDYMDGVKIKG